MPPYRDNNGGHGAKGAFAHPTIAEFAEKAAYLHGR